MLTLGCISKAHPNGDLLTAWSKLDKKYQPKDTSVKLHLQEELKNCTLHVGMDPMA